MHTHGPRQTLGASPLPQRPLHHCEHVAHELHTAMSNGEKDNTGPALPYPLGGNSARANAHCLRKCVFPQGKSWLSQPGCSGLSVACCESWTNSLFL
mmetsp:Transcript_72590/g.151547  ORF Transcript_72590/g.151547 Transcript_72590/m.151547 type:complete len:97 (-) Transcript_72590:36-326(-)